MQFRPEVIPFIIASLVIGGLILVVARLCGARWGRAIAIGDTIAVLMVGYMLFFFRDPERHPPADPAAVVAGADGKVMSIVNVPESKYLKTDCVRVSIFLSLLDVHVNRAPIGGTVKALDFVPGKRYFTLNEKSSDFNQHNSIEIDGSGTRCLVNQIVGPVARRVVYWLHLDQVVQKGDRLGMMKFGSRLDMYFPKDDVYINVKKGDKVRAGETIVATLKRTPSP